jgi:hypothetical protein
MLDFKRRIALGEELFTTFVVVVGGRGRFVAAAQQHTGGGQQ